MEPHKVSDITGQRSIEQYNQAWKDVDARATRVIRVLTATARSFKKSIEDQEKKEKLDKTQQAAHLGTRSPGS